MIFWSVYLFFIGFLVVSAVVVFKAEMSGPSKLLLALIAVMLVYGFYKIKYPTFTYRFRMTVEVDAGGETRSASSVIEVSAARRPVIFPEDLPYKLSVRGQAVYVDLPNGKNLVVLLTALPLEPHHFRLTQIVFSAFKVPKGSAPLSYDQLDQLRGRRELTREQMPTFVTITNPADENTARVIKVDDIDGVLGVHLRSISIEMTNDGVSSLDIEHRLPFVTKLCERRMEYRYPDKFIPNCSDFLRH
jgi:hypothetical protein